MSEEMVQRVQFALVRTWDRIAQDVIDVSPDGVATRGIVIEMVTDADRLKFHGGDPEAADWFYAQSPKRQRYFLLKAFPREAYG